MSLETNKNLGGIGAILILISVFAVFFFSYLGILALVGLIMILVSLHGLADYYKDGKIFTHALYGFIAEIVGVAAAFVALFYIVFDTSILTDFLYKIYPGWNGSWASLPGMTATTSGIGYSDVAPVLGAIALVGVIFWVFTIVSTILDRQSFKALSMKSNVGLFSTGALLLVIGAVLTVILIGFVLLWVGTLLLAIAFFRLKPQMEQQFTATSGPPVTPTPV